MPLRYKSGEEIRKGDLATLNGKAAEIELVADPEEPEEATRWYVEQYGAGVLIKEPLILGHLFLTQERLLEDCDDLQFKSRAEANGFQ